MVIFFLYYNLSLSDDCCRDFYPIQYSPFVLVINDIYAPRYEKIWFCHMRITEMQISLCICSPVQSEHHICCSWPRWHTTFCFYTYSLNLCMRMMLTGPTNTDFLMTRLSSSAYCLFLSYFLAKSFLIVMLICCICVSLIMQYMFADIV